MFIVVTRTFVDADGITRVAKHLDFATRPQADAALSGLIGEYPAAFVAAKPPADVPVNWAVNLAGKSLSAGGPPQKRPAFVEPKAIRALRRIAEDMAEPAKSEVLAILNGS